VSGAEAELDAAIAARGGATAVVANRGAANLVPYPLLGAGDFHTLTRLSWRIKPVLPATGCGALIGISGAGKSFVAVDMAAALGSGERWFGYRVKPCRVVYVALEGDAGLRRRVEAWERQNERAFPDAVLFLFESFRITSPEDVRRLAASINQKGGAEVIIIDTLNRSAPEADENASADMGRILEGLKELQLLTGGLVMPVHHVGKDASKGMRGHSSLHAALDAVIEVCHVEAGREIRLSKVKDGQDGAAHPFRLQVVDLGEDEDGDLITSCIVLPEADDERPQLPRAPKGGNQRIVYDALGPLFRESTAFGKAGAPPVGPCLLLDAAIEHVRERLPVESKRKTERARQAVRGLVASGVLGCDEGWIWLM